VFQLTGEQPELLGRQSTHIRLTDAQTSRRHAQVLLENNTWLIRDLDSTNGTWVNGQKITQITELEPGDRIVIGRHQFRVSAITDVPAPQPQPKAPTPEPIIGHEELGSMGMDLEESLSADLLEDADQDLPQVPDASSTAPDAQPKQPPEDQPPDHSPDAVVTPTDAGPDTPDTPGTTQTPDADTPAEPGAPGDSASQPTTPSGTQPVLNDGVIDLDTLLAEPALPAATSSPQNVVEDASPHDSTPAQDSAPAPAEQAKSTEPPAAGEVDFDLDEMLGLEDEPVTQPPASTESSQAHTLGAEDKPDEAETDKQEPHEAAAKQDEVPAQADIPAFDTQPPVDSADSEQTKTLPPDDVDSDVDSIGDIDDLLEDLADEPKAPDTPDPESSAEQDEHDQVPAPPSPSDEPDSLIDIDILAAAKPADSWTQASPDTTEGHDATPATPDTEPTGVSHDSRTGPDDSAILGGADTGVELDDNLQNPPEENPVPDPDPNLDTLSEAEQDQARDEDPGPPELDESSTPDQQQELDDSERALLLSPDEQTLAVQSYRRSKLKTLIGLAVVLLTLGAAAWYAFDHYTNRADAKSQPPNQNTPPNAPPADHGLKPTPEVATTTQPPLKQTPDSPAATTRTPSKPKPAHPGPLAVETPVITEPVHHPAQPIEPAPPTTDPSLAIATDTLPADSSHNGPAKSDTPKPLTGRTDRTLADPFADISTHILDRAPSTPTPHEPAPPPQQTHVNPAVETKADTQTPQPADAAMVTAGQPPIPSTPPTQITPGNDTATGPDLNATLPVASKTTDDSVHTTAQQPSITTEPATPTSEDQSQLDLLAGAVDAQHKPGDRVSDQAAFAGSRRVVYVVDASGSLVDSFPLILRELNQTISKLKEDQAFTVIFFGADGVIEVPPVGLKWADRDNKRRVSRWTDPGNGNVTAWGRGDLMQALKLATGYGADEIVILSDNLIGRQPSQEKIDSLLDDIDTLTHDKAVHIHVIQFFNRDPKQVLKSIAKRFNGTYLLIPNMPDPSAEHPDGDPLALP